MQVEQTKDTFKLPKKTTKLSTIISQPARQIETRNKYDSLGEETDDEDPQPRNQYAAKPKPKKKETPPPIIIAGRPSNHKELTTELNSHIKQGYHIRYAKNSIIIYVHTSDEYKKYVQTLSSDNVEFHTYTQKETRDHAFILRGLQGNPDTADITQDLENTHKITVKQIYQMKTNYNPLYLIVTTSDYTLGTLNQKAKYVLNTKISWEQTKD